MTITEYEEMRHAHLDATKHPDRDDDEKAHIGDLPFCLRKTWFRRNGVPKSEPTTKKSLELWQGGRRLQADIAASLERRFPGKVRQEVECAIGEMVGHADIVVDLTDPLLWETKQTSQFKKKDQPSDWYNIQLCGYLTAFGYKLGKLVVQLRDSLDELFFDVMLTPDRERWIREKAATITEQTAPGAPIPAPVPIYAWECGYCDWRRECEKKK